MLDIRKFLFSGIKETPFRFEIVADEEGIFVGSERLTRAAGHLGIQVVRVARDGDPVGKGDVVFGLIISTGGVGAENKDFTVEAIRRLDPGAYTPYILKFTPDHHRHYKEGVRIALGKVGPALLIALPGPHEEAKLGSTRLLAGLKQGMEGFTLAEYIADVLRDREGFSFILIPSASFLLRVR